MSRRSTQLSLTFLKRSKRPGQDFRFRCCRLQLVAQQGERKPGYAKLPELPKVVQNAMQLRCPGHGWVYWHTSKTLWYLVLVEAISPCFPYRVLFGPQTRALLRAPKHFSTPYSPVLVQLDPASSTFIFLAINLGGICMMMLHPSGCARKISKP